MNFKGMFMDAKEKILSELRDCKDGLSFTQLSAEIGFSIATISKFCYILQAEKMVTILDYGNVMIVKINEAGSDGEKQV